MMESKGLAQSLVERAQPRRSQSRRASMRSQSRNEWELGECEQRGDDPAQDARGWSLSLADGRTRGGQDENKQRCPGASALEGQRAWAVGNKEAR